MEKTLKSEAILQYAHIWRVFTRLVLDFDERSWFCTGRKATTPARLSFHILQATKYYLEDTSVVAFASGKSFAANSETSNEAALPSRSDIVASIQEFGQITERWIATMELSSTNHAFPWAGNSKLGVVIFLLKHNVFHLGELSSLLNESKHGEAQDHYVQALEG